MQENAIEILNSHSTMAISTLRADGWPQTTIVGYANDGSDFFIFSFSDRVRSSRTFDATCACRSRWVENRKILIN